MRGGGSVISAMLSQRYRMEVGQSEAVMRVKSSEFWPDSR